MSRKHTYHKENCENKVRAIVTDKFGHKVVLLGQHAFEWSIAMQVDGQLVITSYKNRKEATKEFNRYKK